MIRSLVATLIAVVFMGALAMPVQADSTATSGTLTGTTTLTTTGTIGFFESSFSGSGVESVSGIPFTTTNTGTLTFTSPTAFTISGTFVDVFSDGTIFGTYTGSGTEIGGGVADVTTDAVITGGTGIFAGDTGESTITSTSTGTGLTASVSGTFTTFVTSPEPSSLALLLAGIGLLPVMRKRIAHSRQPAA
jgi:hypothetical protein